jgi:trigger factor
MIGMKIGDKKDVKVVFPKKYHDKNMAGKDAKFNVKIHEVFKKSVPTLNDTLAIESNIPNVKTLAELKAFIKKAISNAKMVSSKTAFKNEAFKLIKKDIDLVIPEVLINQEVQRLVKQFEENIKRQNISIKDYLKANNMDSKDVIERFKIEARVRLLDTFIFAEIAGKEKFEITDAEYEEQYKSVANMYRQDLATVKKSIPKQQLQIQLMNDKVIDFLIKNRKK